MILPERTEEISERFLAITSVKAFGWVCSGIGRGFKMDIVEGLILHYFKMGLWSSGENNGKVSLMLDWDRRIA